MSYVALYGAHGLNITNTLALDFYKNKGFKDVVISFETTEKTIKNLGSDLPRGIYVYGHLPLMLMRTCPQKGESGCGNCNGKTHLTDRKGISFPLLCRDRQYSVLHNSVPLYIGDKNLTSIDFGILYFTTETAEQCARIYETFSNNETIPGLKTNGLFYRELL